MEVAGIDWDPLNPSAPCQHGRKNGECSDCEMAVVAWEEDEYQTRIEGHRPW